MGPHKLIRSDQEKMFAQAIIDSGVSKDAGKCQKKLSIAAIKRHKVTHVLHPGLAASIKKAKIGQIPLQQRITASYSTPHLVHGNFRRSS